MSDQHGRNDDRIRALLDDAVSDVEPRPGLDRIQARTKVTPMSSKRPWIFAAAGAVVATAATVVAVNVVADDDPRTAGGRPATTPTASQEPTPSPSPSEDPQPTGDPSEGSGESTAVPVYYAGDTNTGPRLFREFHQLEKVGTPAGQVRVALEEALTDTALDPDYRSPWPAGTTVAGVTVDGTEAPDVVFVDLTGTPLHDRPRGMSEAEASIALEQLIYTAQAVLQQRRPVQFLLDGERTDAVLGMPTSEPLAEGDPMQVQGTVWIINPQDGDVVEGPIQVEGRGAFFEANVNWELLQDGEVVDEGFTTAEEGMVLSPYSFTVDAEPGDYVLRVYDADMSGGEGNGEAEDTKRVTVTD
jgi:hypothetical protein